MHRVFVLGAGRAGRSLASALAAAGRPVAGLHGRRAPAAGAPATETAGDLRATALRDADVVLVTVRDAQLDDALAELARSPLDPRAVVLHASGASDPAGLAALRARGNPAGTFHPLVPLASPEQGAAALRGAWIGVDGDDAARAVARELAAAIGAHILEIPAGAKPAYHAAAVFASNFPAVLAGAAAALLRGAGVERAAADGAVHALLAAAVGNLAGRPLDAAGVAAVLTGPVVRGDATTIAAHLEALGGRGAMREAYLALSRLALETTRAAGEGSPRLDDVRRVLDGAGSGDPLPAAVSDRR